jgi:CelD/BcsL family acetyltransferase involved in cellulose biosynthesis
MSWKVFPARAKFAAYADAWQKLNDRGARTPLLDAMFIGLLLESFGTGRELLAVRNGSMAVLEPEGFGRWQTFQPSQAPVGAWVSDPENPPAEGVLRRLVGKLPGLVLACGVSQMDPEIIERPDETRRLHTLDYIKTSRIVFDGTFEEYWAKRPQNLRANVRRRCRRLEEAGTPPRLVTITDPAAMAKAVEEYAALESSGWKGENGTAIAVDNAQGRFYTRLLEEYAKRGEATVFQCRFGDRLAASDLCLHRDGVIIVLKVAYDEQLASSGPSFVLRREELKHLFDSHEFKRLEFYGKVRDWHTKFTDDIRQMYHVTAYRWAMVPKILALRHRGVDPPPAGVPEASPPHPVV